MVADEQDLLRKIRASATRETAFTEMMKAWQQGLYWHIRQIVPDHIDADDILQNTFIKAWNNLDSFQGNSKLRTWLYRIGTNEALNWLAARKRFVNLDGELPDSAESTYTSGVNCTSEDAEALLVRALEQLPPRQKLVFNLKYYEELTYEEIAEILGGTTGGHKASFHHAVKKIERFVQESLNLSPY